MHMRRPRAVTDHLSGEEALSIPDVTFLTDVPPTMFGGYAEVAGIYVEDDFIVEGDENGSRGPIPSDYIPEYSPPDAWNNNSTCRQDFIMIAEFSEQEGPKPLITFPENAGGDFDLNEFSVRIMSVDYQGMAGDQFSTCQDTQVILSESVHNMYAYVHHFTLHDSQARGFVRPFCMSFVTTSLSKLSMFYEELHKEFSKVSQCFKFGNLIMFVRDMTHYLSDLHYTKERFIERNNALNEEGGMEKQVADIVLGDEEEEAVLQSVTLQGIEGVIDEVRAILETTTDLIENEKTLIEQIQKLEEQHVESQDELDVENFHYSCSLHGSSPGTSQTTEPISSQGLYERSASMDDNNIYRPKVVRTTNKKRFDKILRTLHELCQYGAKEGLRRLQSIYKYFSRELPTLLIEKRDSHLIDPPAGLLTIGRSVQLNFLTGLRGTQSPDSDFTVNSDMFTASSLTESSMGKWLSDDTFGSIGSFHSAESFLSCQDDPSLQDMVPKSAYHPTLCMGSVTLTHNNSLGSVESTTGSDKQNCNSINENIGTKKSGHPSETKSICSTSSTTESELENGAGKPSSLSSQPVCEERILSPEPGHHEPVKVSVISAADHISNISTTSPGYGILEFAHRYPFCPEMFYSLLCGRPLVVVGSSRIEAEIRAAVTALWLFVPGHSSHCEEVIPWSTKPLKVTDLSNVRIIGLGKSDKRTLDSILPSSVRSYVSMLDLDKKILSAPPYQGGLLTDIHTKRKVFQDESSYIAYIHSVLNEFCLKAYTFYHGFCMNGAIVDSLKSKSRDPCHRKEFQSVKSEFCSRLRLSVQDTKIVQYLATVVKEQQIYELNIHKYADNEVPVTSIKLDYSLCKTFKLLS